MKQAPLCVVRVYTKVKPPSTPALPDVPHAGAALIVLAKAQSGSLFHPPICRAVAHRQERVADVRVDRSGCGFMDRTGCVFCGGRRMRRVLYETMISMIIFAFRQRCSVDVAHKKIKKPSVRQ